MRNVTRTGRENEEGQNVKLYICFEGMPFEWTHHVFYTSWSNVYTEAKVCALSYILSHTRPKKFAPGVKAKLEVSGECVCATKQPRSVSQSIQS